MGLTIAFSVLGFMSGMLAGYVLGYNIGHTTGSAIGWNKGWFDRNQEIADARWAKDPNGDPENVAWGLNVVGDKIPEIELED